MLGGLLQFAAEVAGELGLDAGGYRIVTNTGPDAGQSVDHLHFHVLGGPTDDVAAGVRRTEGRKGGRRERAERSSDLGAIWGRMVLATVTVGVRCRRGGACGGRGPRAAGQSRSGQSRRSAIHPCS